MKIKELNDLRSREKKDILKELEEKRLELSKAIVNVRITKEKNLKKAKFLRRDISQILTIIREDEIIAKKA